MAAPCSSFCKIVICSVLLFSRGLAAAPSGDVTAIESRTLHLNTILEPKNGTVWTAKSTAKIAWNVCAQTTPRRRCGVLGTVNPADLSSLETHQTRRLCSRQTLASRSPSASGRITQTTGFYCPVCHISIQRRAWQVTDRLGPGTIYHAHGVALSVLFDEVAYRNNGSITVNVPFLEEGDDFTVVSKYYMLEGIDRVTALLTSDSQSTRMTL